MVRWWREFVRKWTMRSAIRQGRKARGVVRDDERSGFIFIFPANPSLAKTLVLPVRNWLSDHMAGPVRAVVPSRALELTKQLRPGVRTITFDESDRTKSDLPTRDLRRRVAQQKARVAVLLTEENDPFNEILFAVSSAPLKAALYADGREDYINLQVRPNDAHPPTKKIQFLLDAIVTFAGSHLKIPADSDIAIKAAEAFSNPEDKIPA